MNHKLRYIIERLKRSGGPENSHGAVLLTVVFILIIIGLVGSAIYSLTYTSTYTQMSAQNATRAYYIAESGARIVAAEYNQAAAANKNTTLESLHNEALTLPGNNGQIDLRIYPYWFYVNSLYSSGNNAISVRMPGGIPLMSIEDPGSSIVTIPGSGRLKLQGKTVRADITASSRSGNIITFTLGSQKFPYDIQPDEEIFLVYKDATSSQSINQDGTLLLPSTNQVAQFIPTEQGSFRIHNEDNDRMDYTYREKVASGGNFQLIGIRSQDPDPANPSLFPFSVDGASEVYFGKNLAVVATSALGLGRLAGQETVVTYTDVGLDGGFYTGRESISFEDDIEDFNYPGLPINSPGGNDPIVVDETNKEINLGGGLNDGYGSVWYGGSSDRANCIDGRCNLGKGFRAYFEFVSNLTDSSADSKTYGDGFTFSIISGVWDGSGYRNDKYDTGGPLGEYLGYAGPGLSTGDGTGLESPKIALELDTFPNTGAGSLCPPNTNSRNDDTPVANHIALDYWGVGSTSNTPGSLDAIGGYMRVGSTTPLDGAPEDWSSSQGTISFWFKLDSVPLGAGDRLWGQNANMETRFIGNDIYLDWGTGAIGNEGENAIIAVHPFTQVNKWYFIGITWDDAADQLRLYWGDESTPVTLFAENLLWEANMSPTGLITENLFMNSSGGDGTKTYMIEGNGTDLRYYNVARNITDIDSDFDLRLDGTEVQQPQVYYPLESDFANAAALLPVAKSVSSTAWSDETPAGFDCSSDIATRDDNRHGTGGSTTQPMNSLNTNPGLGDDGYYQVVKGMNPNNWMEDGDCYGVRLELVRPKDPDGGVYKYQIKAWVNSVDATCTGLTANYKDVAATYTATDPQIELTIDNSNPLELAESVHLDLKDILFGFTQATGTTTQDITLKALEMRFIKNYPAGFPSTW